VRPAARPQPPPLPSSAARAAMSPSIPAVPSIPSISSIPSMPSVPKPSAPIVDETVTSPAVPAARVPAPAPAPRAPAIDPVARQKAMGLYELALADLRGGKKARAHMYAKMAKEACPDEPKINSLLANWGQAEAHAKRESEDQRLFDEAIRLEESGDYVKAVATLQKAIAVNSTAPELHNRLGVILATRICDYTAASNSLLRAVELDSKNLVYRSNLGKVFKMSEGKSVGALITDPNAVPREPIIPPPKSMMDKLRGKLK
jgi:tetratricopeptide (TPR) repeat protein